MSLYRHERNTSAKTGALRPARKTWQRPMLNVERLKGTAAAYNGSGSDGTFFS